MDENYGSSARVPKELLHGLMARRDGPGLLRFGASALTFAGAGAATLAAARGGSPLWIPAVVVAGAALTTLFPALHEAGHGTAFRSRPLNAGVAAICAFMMLQAPAFFREFHWQHHRATQDRAADPEIAGAPALLDGWARDPLTYLGLASGQALLLGKAMFTLSCALLPSAAIARLFPFIRADRRRTVARQSRVVVALWAAVLAAGLAWVDCFAYLLLAWPIAHVFLGFYLMAEHTGLPNSGSQLARTRSVESNAVVRWLMWNMPLHTAHHAYPAVPFHAVPDLHSRLRPELEHVSRGYVAFHADALMRALRLR
ncbi:MAG: fatty acid desaturase [Nannocystaceae bacterium]